MLRRTVTVELAKEPSASRGGKLLGPVPGELHGLQIEVLYRAGRQGAHERYAMTCDRLLELSFLEVAIRGVAEVRRDPDPPLPFDPGEEVQYGGPGRTPTLDPEIDIALAARPPAGGGTEEHGPMDPR